MMFFPCACTQGFLILNQAGGVIGMSANLEAKKVIVGDIVEKLKNAESLVICSFSGLTVEQVTQLRKNCRENDVHYCVLKNRLVARALKELNIEGLDHLLEGPNAFVFGEKDVTAAPKMIQSFIDKNKLTSLEIKGGLMGTEVMDVAAVKALAATPSRDELLATMVVAWSLPYLLWFPFSSRSPRKRNLLPDPCLCGLAA
jgi:large subunit ribosomal protein L10